MLPKVAVMIRAAYANTLSKDLLDLITKKCMLKPSRISEK